MGTECWIPMVTDIHSEYKILVTVPPQVITQTRLVLRLYVQCLSCSFYKPPKTRVRGFPRRESGWEREAGNWPPSRAKNMSTAIFSLPNMPSRSGAEVRAGKTYICFTRTQNITFAPQSLRTTLKNDRSKILVCVYLLWIETHQLHDAVNGSVVSVTQPLHAVVATTHKTQVAG